MKKLSGWFILIFCVSKFFALNSKIMNLMKMEKLCYQFINNRYAYVPLNGEKIEVLMNMQLAEVEGNEFNYFGYGSNLLAARIHIENKSAVRKSFGKLKNHRLDFYTFTERWNGAPATIVPTNNSNVYGAVWSIDLKDLPDLDRQEGVHTNTYQPKTVTVETPEGIVICRAYFLTDQPTTILKEGEKVPFDRQPSKTYLKTLVKGAIETGIPESYINWMKKIKHNGNIVDKFEKQLELESVELLS